ncbi:MAG: hypothetical protein L0G99_15660 [Propionibacteriales bacterium]|nr:hypothetical protein [Propionibacteriales bacterium]
MTTIAAAWMRGGTSKCWVFEREALEVPGWTVDEVLLRLFGSPDSRQVDGIGGATSTTSKAVILSRSDRPGIDVDYTFAQVGIAEESVDWGSNCGNCSAVVAPYALQAGWVTATDPEVLVRILNTNSDQVILERVNAPDGDWQRLDTSIPGVLFPGTGVGLGFCDPSGRTTGALLPTGAPVDNLPVTSEAEDRTWATATLIDAGAPLVIVDPTTAGLDQVPFEDWSVEVLSELARLESIRRSGAVSMGLARTEAEAARAIPKLAIVGPPSPGSAADLDILMLSMGRPHPALAITGSVGLTIAAATAGTLVARALNPEADANALRFNTPAGVIDTWRRTVDGEDVVGTIRTARLIATAELPLPPRQSAPTLDHTSKETVVPTPLPPPSGADRPLTGASVTGTMQQDEPPKHSRRTILTAVGAFAMLGLGTSVAGAGLLNPPATTEDGDFAGETLEVIIPLAEGGGTDTWARFIGSELVQVIPGVPGFAPTNEAGGEGITATNRFARSAEESGTEILVSTASTVVPWVLERDVVRYSFADLTPILVNGTGGVIYARTAAGVRSVADLRGRDKPLVFGGISATGLDLTTLVAFDLLEAQTSATFGFEGRGPVNLALQRGEVDIDYTTTSSYSSAVEGIAKEGKATVLMSFGQLDEAGEVIRDPNFPDVPTVVEAYAELHGREPQGPKLEAYKTMLGLTYTYQKGLWAPAATPDKAVELLRSAAERLAGDDKFNERAAEILGGYPIVADTKLAERIGRAYTVTETTRQYVVALLKDTYGIEVQ